MFSAFRWVAAVGVVTAAVVVGPRIHLQTPPPEPPVAHRVALTPAGERWESEPIAIRAVAAGLAWDGPAPDAAWVRSSPDGVAWSPWAEVPITADHGPDPGTAEAASGRAGSDPVLLDGDAAYVQYRVDGASGAVRAEILEPGGGDLTWLERLQRFLRSVEITWATPGGAVPERPSIVTRAEWGADGCEPPPDPDDPDAHHLHVADRARLLFVHHTNHGGNENGYSRSDAPELVLAVCKYHVNVRGWSDIAYNFVIDRFGTIYEGRAGSIDGPVIGAHTGGFNSWSVGVAFLGDHGGTPPSPEAQDAFRRLAAWLLDRDHVDPTGTVTVESLGSTLWEEGVEVTFPAIAGHRQASSTSCPGDACYALLGALRADVRALGGPKIFGGWSAADPLPGLPKTGYEPTPFSFSFDEPMDWTFTITDPAGTEVHRATGSGISAAVFWDGTFEGVPLPVDTYTATVTAATADGRVPTPASFSFRLGDYRPPFSDDDDSLHEPDIAAVAALGVTAGCGGDRFCPDEAVTRWQMALFLDRLWNALAIVPTTVSDPPAFVDVDALDPTTRAAIERLAVTGVTSGVAPDRYGPDAEVPRWQMALFLVRWLDAAGYPLPDHVFWGFTDTWQLPDDVKVAIDLLAQLGITTGTSATTYAPDAPVTRAQMASFLNRTAQLIAQETPTP